MGKPELASSIWSLKTKLRVFSLYQISLLILTISYIMPYKDHIDSLQEAGINGDEGDIYLGVAHRLLGLCHYVVSKYHLEKPVNKRNAE